MPDGQAIPAAGLRRYLSSLTAPHQTDAELLDRFVANRDESAFAELVRRHSPVVLAVCQRVARNRDDADDAFQATFLVLARKAGRIRPGEPLGAWLYGVAVNTARVALTRTCRRRARETAGADFRDVPGRTRTVTDPDDIRMLLEEVARLSDRHRAAVVLCELEGYSRSTAAKELGIPEGTLSSRLAVARQTLAARLRRRGVVQSAAGLSVALAEVAAARPSDLMARAVAVAVGSGTTTLVPAGRIPPGVLSLTEGVLSVMRFTHVNIAAAIVALAIGLTAALAAVPPDGTLLPHPDRTQPVRAKALPAPAMAKPDPKELEGKELKAFKGSWRLVRGEAHGKPLDEELMVTKLVVFDGHDLRMHEPKGDGKEEVTEHYEFALTPTVTPRCIDLTVRTTSNPEAGKVYYGIYELNGDTLTLCVREDSADAKNRPTELKAGDDGLTLLVFERVKEEKEELKAFIGEWKGTKLNVSGTDLEGKDAEVTWNVADASVLLAGGVFKEEKLMLKLEPAAALPTIDLTVAGGNQKGTELVGIYFRQGDRLTVCFADPKVEGATRPTELKPGDGRVFLVLERNPKK